MTLEKIFDIYLHVADSVEKIEKRSKTKEEGDNNLSGIFLIQIEWRSENVFSFQHVTYYVVACTYIIYIYSLTYKLLEEDLYEYMCARLSWLWCRGEWSAECFEGKKLHHKPHAPYYMHAMHPIITPVPVLTPKLLPVEGYEEQLFMFSSRARPGLY